ncbi:hypothetical protein ZWY2020_012231 [Hordeum vulgare]|nr:hypothetical protein ZWY2020_012231 [Hordeum vulgare]
MLRPAGALEHRDGPRPTLVSSAARSQLKILHPNSGHGATTATRAVAGSDVQTSPTATSARVEGKLLLQSSDSPNSPLRLSLQLVSATVPGVREGEDAGGAAQGQRGRAPPAPGEGLPTDKPLQKWERVYDYALYNDLGNPDLRKDLARPVLGGSKEYPYPRRTRTSRPPSKADPASETRAPLEEGIYIPCDERTGPVAAAPNLPKIDGHFGSLADVHGLFDSNAKPFAFPVHRSSQRIEQLDRAVYGDQDSKITKEHIQKNLGNITVAQAIEKKRLFALDHHDWVMPYLKRINELPGAEEKGEISQRKSYATRTLFFLQDDSTLKPLAIELSSPHPEDERLGATSTAHASSNDACKNNYVLHWLGTHATMEPVVIAANRQLSVLHPIHKLLKPHFRNTLDTNSTARHIVIGAADQRQNGGFYRNMHEVNFFASKYGMEMSSKAYASYNFTELAFPNELIKRGMVRRDPKKNEELELPRKDEPNIWTAIWKWVTGLLFPSEPIKTGVARGDTKKHEQLELLIKDYPYAVDGMKIWTAIKKWVTDYCAIYYANEDRAVAADSKLQAWWSEVRNVGHGDLSDAPWWPAMDCVDDLVETCATIIWLGSAYHSAVSFGQYAYNGFVPNRPTITSGEMPADSGAVVTEAEFLGSITPRTETFALMALTMNPPVKPESRSWGSGPTRSGGRASSGRPRRCSSSTRSWTPSRKPSRRGPPTPR